MPAPSFKVTLDVTDESDETITAWCCKHLTEQGYNVTPPGGKWEKLTDFIKRLDICYQTFYRATNRGGCPSWQAHRSASGRLLELCSNDDLDAWVKRFKDPSR